MKLVFLGLLLLQVYGADNVIGNQIAQIDRSQFGKTLLDTVFLQLQAQEPIERLLGTLEQLEDRYIQEQKEDDSAHAEFQDSCSSDISALDLDLKNSNDEKVRLEAKLEGELYPKRAITQKLLKQKEGELKQLSNELSELDQERAEGQKEFEFKVNEHIEINGILEETKHLFTSNLERPSGESGFIQKTNTVHKEGKLSKHGIELIQKHLNLSIKRASKFQHRKSWGKMLKAFATIATRSEQLADQSKVGRIVELCDQLIAKVADSLDLERFAEQKRIESYNKTRNLLTISINVVNTALANATSELAVINDRIEQTQASLDTAIQRIELLDEQRLDRFTQCEQEAEDYMNERQARTDDRNVVSQTIGLINQQLRGLREQLAMRMQAGEKIEYY